jgi:hypothetical protein
VAGDVGLELAHSMGLGAKRDATLAHNRQVHGKIVITLWPEFVPADCDDLDAEITEVIEAAVELG